MGAKTFFLKKIKIRQRKKGGGPPLKTHIDCISSSRIVRLPGGKSTTCKLFFPLQIL